MVFSLTEQAEGRARAIAFVIDAYEGVRTAAGKGLPHAQAVADILRDAGYDQQVQVVGLLHDVVEDTPRSIDDVRDGFGEPIAAMVGALTEDDSIADYPQRKRALRAQVIGAGPQVVAIALADKIATLQHARITKPASAGASSPTTRPRCNSPSPPASTTRSASASPSCSTRDPDSPLTRTPPANAFPSPSMRKAVSGARVAPPRVPRTDRKAGQHPEAP